MSTQQTPKPRLRALPAILVVLFYLAFSIIATLFTRIFFNGLPYPTTGREIDDVVDQSLVANLIVLGSLLIISLWVFRKSRRDIFFEARPSSLPAGYYLFPLAWLAVTVFALTQVDYSHYSAGVILLVVVAALTIGVNEETVARGILLVGLRNSGVKEWVAWLITLVAFSLMHIFNVLGGGSIAVLVIVLTGGTLLYASRRIFGNLFVPIGLHALYDVAFYLLSGSVAAGADLPDRVLDIQLGSFLFLLVVSILFPIFGRRLLKTTGAA